MFVKSIYDAEILTVVPPRFVSWGLALKTEITDYKFRASGFNACQKIWGVCPLSGQSAAFCSCHPACHRQCSAPISNLHHCCNNPVAFRQLFERVAGNKRKSNNLRPLQNRSAAVAASRQSAVFLWKSTGSAFCRKPLRSFCRGLNL